MSPAKSSTLEVSNDNKVSEEGLAGTEKIASEKEASRFSGVLDSFTKKESAEEKAQGEADASAAESLSSEGELLDSALFLESIEGEDSEIIAQDFENDGADDIELASTESIDIEFAKTVPSDLADADFPDVDSADVARLDSEKQSLTDKSLTELEPIKSTLLDTEEVANEPERVNNASIDIELANSESIDQDLTSHAFSDDQLASKELTESEFAEVQTTPIIADELTNSGTPSVATLESSATYVSEKALFEPHLKGEVQQADNDLASTEDIDPNSIELEGVQHPLNPILAQIENAQKTDTKVSELKTETLTETPELSLKISNKLSEESMKATKLSTENLLNEGVMAGEKEEAETTIKPSNKIESLLSVVKPEVDRLTADNKESNNLMPTLQTTSALDKSLHKAPNSSPLMQSTQLQQPIDLQAKQAPEMMGEKIMMMINQGKQEVTIRLDPAELGTMHIKLQVQQDQLQVGIQTQLGQSRDIIEQNLPRLREQLAQQGINLGETNVQQQNRQDQSQSQGSPDERHNPLASSGSITDAMPEEQTDWIRSQIQRPAQGIDYYA